MARAFFEREQSITCASGNELSIDLVRIKTDISFYGILQRDNTNSCWCGFDL